jgi:hypothetical protein
VKEFDIYIPLRHGDGQKVDARKLKRIQSELVDRFGGLTNFPQANLGLWKFGNVVYRDEIVIYRVLSSEARAATRFLRAMRRRLESELNQDEILIVARDVKAL